MKIAVLCSPCQTTEILLTHLAGRADDTMLVIRETKLPATAILRHRIRRLGLFPTLGQVAFMAIVPRLLARRAQRRIEQLLNDHGASAQLPLDLPVRDVETINDQETIDALTAFEPDVVLVNGTRIIRARVLDAVSAPFINIHAGITPLYRGVHGGYWALYNNDGENFGSTIHLVDKGVDTGPVLKHVRSVPAPVDNFVTYPLLQFLSALPSLDAILASLADAVASAAPASVDADSRQWYHPTLLQYMRGYIRGIS